MLVYNTFDIPYTFWFNCASYDPQILCIIEGEKFNDKRIKLPRIESLLKSKGIMKIKLKIKLFIPAFAIITIQVQNNSTFVELGRTDIGIRCLVNDSEIERIIGIQLLRSNTRIVSVNEHGVFWQDEELQQRAVADSSVINAPTYYLHMTIDRQMVTKNDGGTYSCISSAQYRSKSVITENTGNIFLNITGIHMFQL